MLVEILVSLTWKSVIVLHDYSHVSGIGRSLEASDISYVDYEISSSTEENLMTILRDVEKVFQPHLNVLLLCDVTTTVLVLRQMSRICGTGSNTTVDWCHVARVLVVGRADDLPVLLENDIKVENVAVLELPSRYQGNSTTSRVWTLMFHSRGRAFTDVVFFKLAARNPMDVFPNVKFGYNGRQLTAVMKENHFGYGHVTLNKRRLFGFSLGVLNLLAEAMNFSYRIIRPREDDWGKNINGSWTGIFGMLQRREADLAPEMLTIHIDRTAVADYILPPLAENKQIILYRKEGDVDEDHLLIFLHPFQTYVFIALVVSLISYTVALSTVRTFYRSNEFNPPVTSKDNSVVQNMETENSRQMEMQSILSTPFEMFGATLKQGSTIRSSKVSERILLAAWWIFTTIFSAVYCGTIMSIFAIRLEKPPFSNLAELAARDDYKVGYDASSITGNLFENSKLSHIMIMKDRVRDSSARDLDVLSSNVTKHMQKVMKGKYAFIGGPSLIQVSYADCKLSVTDTEFGRTFDSVYLPKQSPFKHDFQKSMSYLSASGILQRTYQEWFPPTEDDGCPEEDFPKAVSLLKIQSVFIAIGLGLICSVIVLALEIVWYKKKQAHNHINTHITTQSCHKHTR
ncbi:probable glutamate receptor [Haliotis asinina]|uniref:probable glutamate receptor n=1 Tax=Haliotis asinina TaxID=109174 RepID=UPI0035319F00